MIYPNARVSRNRCNQWRRRLTNDPMHWALLSACVALAAVSPLHSAGAGELFAGTELRAGAAKVDITNMEAGPVNDRLYARALVLTNGATTVAIVAIDVVAIGEIGPIGNDYLGKVRSRIERQLDIKPSHVLINASHCHGIVCSDVDERTFQAVQQAAKNMVPVTIGVGTGHEDRIMENRRLKLKNGREIDVRHAYSLPPDDEIAGVGPIDPEIGVLRIDRKDGRTLAAVYNFACHPIQGVPSGGNSADITGFASQVIEDNLDDDTVALFIQGCAGDINPALYKAVERPRDAEPLGNLLGLSTLKALRKVECREDSRLRVLNEVLELPRADVAQRIVAMEVEQKRLLGSLRGTHLNLKTFIPLAVKYSLAGEFPSYYSHSYLHQEALGREDLKKLDTDNRQHLKKYIRNIHIMEELTRIQTNMNLLRRHQAELVESGKRTISVELAALRIGDFVLLTFPGELTVQIGLNIKNKSTHDLTFVAGYTNGYIYYAPTAEQLRNVGRAQEDSDSIVAPEWQMMYENKADRMLRELLTKPARNANEIRLPPAREGQREAVGTPLCRPTAYASCYNKSGCAIHTSLASIARREATAHRTRTRNAHWNSCCPPCPRRNHDTGGLVPWQELEFG